MIDIGAAVVVRGRGLGIVRAIRDGMIVVDETDLAPGEESQFEVPVDSDGVRAVVGRDQAERVLALLRTPAPRLPLDERALAYRRAYKRGDLEEQARLLAGAYSGKPETPETQYQERLEKMVLAELAIALGVSRKTLRAKLRNAAPPPPDRTKELAEIDVPELAGLAAIGAFAVDGRIAVGEAHPEVVIEVERGIWFAYARYDGEEIVELIAVHRGALDAVEQPGREVGRAAIEGAHIAIFDERAAEDPETVEAMWNAAFEIVDGRCAVVALGGDGVGTVFASARHVRIAL